MSTHNEFLCLAYTANWEVAVVKDAGEAERGCKVPMLWARETGEEGQATLTMRR